jgi:hypothetical protein
MLNLKDKDRHSDLLVMESMMDLYLEVITLEISLLLYVLFLTLIPSFTLIPLDMMVLTDPCYGPELIDRDKLL